MVCIVKYPSKGIRHYRIIAGVGPVFYRITYVDPWGWEFLLN